MEATTHTMEWAGETVAIDAWIIVDPINRSEKHFTDPQEAATYWQNLNNPLSRVEAIYAGERHRVAPYAAVAPVYAAMR